MRSRKGMTTLEIVMAFVVLAILGGVLIALIRSGVYGRGTQIGKMLPSSTIMCAQILGVRTPDIDDDGLKDSCDNCVCKEGCRNMEYDFSNPLRPTVIDPRDDKDQDGLPKACDKDDENAEITEWSEECKKNKNIKKTSTGTGRCVIPS